MQDDRKAGARRVCEIAVHAGIPGKCPAGWNTCLALEIDGRKFKNKKLLPGEGNGGEEGSNYVQGRMEKIWGENIDCGVLHIVAGRGGYCGAETEGSSGRF